MKDNYCRTLYYKAWIEDDIFHVVYNIDIVTLPIAKQALETRKQLCCGVDYPMFADIRSLKASDTEASRFMSSAESTQYLRAGALLVNNQFQKVSGNFFIMVNKPPVPAKLFTSEVEAFAWLQQFKNMRSTG